MTFKMLSLDEKKEKRRLYLKLRWAIWYSNPENKKKQNERSKKWAKTPKGKEFREKWLKKCRKLPPPEERFWKQVDKKDEINCWEWLGLKYPSGYGRMCLWGKVEYAHRISYKLSHGDIPKELHVCHSCDNPGCVNPSHLWLGTALDNMRDRDKKGRGRGGFKKLTCVDKIILV